jgi:streptogramin lyase
VGSAKPTNAWTSKTPRTLLLLTLLVGSAALLLLSPSVFAFSPSQNPSISMSNSLTLSGPLSPAFDSSGDLWFINGGTASIWEIVPPFSTTSSASASLELSNGLDGPKAIAFDPSGNLWVANNYDNEIVEFTPTFTGSSSPSVVLTTTNGVDAPTSLAFDSVGDLWVANGNGSIREFDNPVTSSSHTAVKLTADLTSGPLSLALDASGDLVVANYGAGYYYALEWTHPIATGNSPSGWLTSASGIDQQVVSVAVDSSGNVWFGEGDLGKVLEFSSPLTSTGTESYTTYVTNSLNGHEYITLYSSNLWVADGGVNTLFEFVYSSPVPELPYGVLPLLLAFPVLFYYLSRGRKSPQVENGQAR